MSVSKSSAVLACMAVVAIPATGWGREEITVTTSYVIQPSKEIPEGLTTVAVLDAGTEIDGSEDDDRAKKWATIAADMMEHMIHESATEFKSGLTVAKRRDTTKVLAEQDLKAAGLVDAGTATKAAKLLNVQALVTSKVNVRVEVKKSKKTTFDITRVSGFGGRGWGGGSGSIGAREAEQISRNMTVQCKFSMIDAGTGEALFEYAPKPFRKTDKKKPSPIFGRSSGEGDLDPVDEYIGELVEKGTREFVSMFIPCKVEITMELRSSREDASEDGVAAMRGDDYEAAMNHFKAAVAEESDDHESVFLMGVCCELAGKWDDALKYYRKAAGMKDLDDEEIALYVSAKDRMASHKDRIRKKQ